MFVRAFSGHEVCPHCVFRRPPRLNPAYELSNIGYVLLTVANVRLATTSLRIYHCVKCYPQTIRVSTIDSNYKIVMLNHKFAWFLWHRQRNWQLQCRHTRIAIHKPGIKFDEMLKARFSSLSDSWIAEKALMGFKFWHNPKIRTSPIAGRLRGLSLRLNTSTLRLFRGHVGLEYVK